MIETKHLIFRPWGESDAEEQFLLASNPDVAYFAASDPAHLKIAEVLVMPTNQATGTIVHRV